MILSGLLCTSLLDMQSDLSVPFCGHYVKKHARRVNAQVPRAVSRASGDMWPKDPYTHWPWVLVPDLGPCSWMVLRIHHHQLSILWLQRYMSVIALGYFALDAFVGGKKSIDRHRLSLFLEGHCTSSIQTSRRTPYLLQAVNWNLLNLLNLFFDHQTF